MIDDPEGILPLLASDLMPPVVTGLFLTAVLAAIMSTADSVLLLASSVGGAGLLREAARAAAPEPRSATGTLRSSSPG